MTHPQCPIERTQLFSFLNSFFANPMLYIGYAFALCAALAFLVFLRGLLSGIPHLSTFSSNEEHLEHHRTRATWGVMLLLFIFILWEAVQWVAGLFT